MVQLTLPSQTRFLGLVREMSEKMAEVAGFEQSSARRLALAIDEAATNSIQHAYRGAPDRQVVLRYYANQGAFRVDVVDNGLALDPQRLTPPDIERCVRERRKGGLGLRLMAEIMDSVTFSRSASRNVCRLVKRREPLDKVRRRR